MYPFIISSIGLLGKERAPTSSKTEKNVLLCRRQAKNKGLTIIKGTRREGTEMGQRGQGGETVNTE